MYSFYTNDMFRTMLKETSKDKLEQHPAKGSGRWGLERRLAFIDFRLRWEGRINRSDLTDFFGISVPQASLDIARYIELAPENLFYDRSSREYRVGAKFQSLSSDSQPKKYLSELLATSTGVIEPATSFIGWRPSVESVPQPGRVVETEILAAILKAIEQRTGLGITYQSMSSPQPNERTITPHALAYDGFRWHVRAFCHMRQQFRDFVLGRILSVLSAVPAGKAGSEDAEWHTILTLVLAPHPELSDGKRRVIELDYGMKNGESELQCRQALLFYTLRQLGLTQEAQQAPEAQQIILKNRAELESYLSSLQSSS